jgi:hypothetical protein
LITVKLKIFDLQLSVNIFRGRLRLAVVSTGRSTQVQGAEVSRGEQESEQSGGSLVTNPRSEEAENH